MAGKDGGSRNENNTAKEKEKKKRRKKKKSNNRIRATPAEQQSPRSSVGRAKTLGAREHPHRRTNSRLGGVAVWASAHAT